MIPAQLVEQLSTPWRGGTVTGRATTTRSKRVRRSPTAIAVHVDLQVAGAGIWYRRQELAFVPTGSAVLHYGRGGPLT